jgi:hypothetical protein
MREKVEMDERKQRCMKEAGGAWGKPEAHKEGRRRMREDGGV